MTREEAERFAIDWCAHWNARDIDAILGHYAEDVEFTSPLASRYAGQPTLNGRAALRAYWEAALTSITSLRFVLTQPLWDAGAHTLAILYEAELNGAGRAACEVLCFDERGIVRRSMVYYGVDQPATSDSAAPATP